MPTHRRTNAIVEPPPALLRRGAVFNPRINPPTRPHQPLNTKDAWLRLPHVELECGDILIKHAWTVAEGSDFGLGGIEGLIRIGAALNLELAPYGSISAEHAAVVGEVNDSVVICEADGTGLGVKYGPTLAQQVNNTAYSVFRLRENLPAHFYDGLELICAGLATRLAVTQGLGPYPVHMPRYPTVPEDNPIREAVREAHWIQDHEGRPNFLRTKYSWAGLASPLAAHSPMWQLAGRLQAYFRPSHARLLRFIRGEHRDESITGYRNRNSISYICSGLVATTINLWFESYLRQQSPHYSSKPHPMELESNLQSGYGRLFERVGRHGGGVGDHNIVPIPLGVQLPAPQQR